MEQPITVESNQEKQIKAITLKPFNKDAIYIDSNTLITDLRDESSTYKQQISFDTLLSSAKYGCIVTWSINDLNELMVVDNTLIIQRSLELEPQWVI